MNNYNYKQLASISIKDFRNLGEVNIDFTKSPIVCLKGGNEAGKSSVVIALKTLGSNLSSRQYKEYIRTGTDGWVVMLYTMDGKAVYRKKTVTKQTYGLYEFINGKYELVWSIDKLDENAVPQEVQSVVGFTTEPETKELLNVRTYEDQMLFVETSGGSNYKVMYNALKIDNLSRAIKVGNAEAKIYRQEVDQAQNSVLTCKEQLRKIRTVDIEPLLKIRKRLQEESNIIRMLSNAINCQKSIKEAELKLDAIKEVGKLSKIDEYVYTKLESVYNIKYVLKQIEERYTTLESIRKLETVDTLLLDKFNNACNLKNSINRLNTNIYKDIDKCGLVDLSLQEKLESTYNLLQSYKRNNNRLEVYKPFSSMTVINEKAYNLLDKSHQRMFDLGQTNMQYMQIKSSIDNFYNQLKLQNIPFEVCPNCGELIISDSMHHD